MGAKYPGRLPQLRATAAGAAALADRSGNMRAFGGYLPGTKVVLLGDSQTNGSQQSFTPNAVSYDSPSGVMTCTVGLSFSSGERTKFTVRADPKWNVYDAPCTLIDATHFSLQLPTGLAGQPTLGDIRIGRSSLLQASGVWGYLKSALRGGVTLLRNAGVTGETISQVRQRVLTEVTPLGADVIIWQGGNNDIQSGTAEQMFADTLDLLATLPANAAVVLINQAAATSAYGGWTGATLARCLQFNDYLKSIPAIFPEIRIRIVDAYARAVGAGGYSQATMMQADGYHWSGRLSVLIAQDVADAVRSLGYGCMPDVLPQRAEQSYHASTNPNAINKYDNALVQLGASPYATGFSNGSAGAGAFTSSVVGSVQAASWGVGKSQKITYTPAAAGDIARLNLPSVAGRFVPGQKVRFKLRLKTTGLAGQSITRYLSVFAIYRVDAGTQWQIGVWASGAIVAEFPQQDWDTEVFSEPIQLPTGAALTNLNAAVIHYLDGPGAPCSIEVGQIFCEPVA